MVADATVYTESYTYHPAGGVTGKMLALNRTFADNYGTIVTGTASLSVAYAYL